MGPVLLGAVKVLLVVQATQATVVGTVRDVETSQPLAGAVVALADLDHRATATDESGRYGLRQVPPGEHQITVRFIGYAQHSLHALVPREGELTINFWLRSEPVRIQAIDVRAPAIARAGDTAEFPDREISVDAVRNHPLLAEPDVFEALGGGEVFLRPESPSGVNVRGSASDQTAYLLDGIPVFNPFHAGGMSSGWNPDALSRLHLSATAPLLAYPHSLSGAIEAVTRAPGDRLRAQGSVSTIQSRLTFDAPLGRDGAGYLVSLRSGLPDGIAPRQEASYLRGETGDWLAKLEAPVLGGRVQLLGYGNENDLNTAAAVSTDDGTAQDARRNVFEWYSRSLGARWRRVFSGTAVNVLGWSAAGEEGSIWSARAGWVDMAAARRDQGLLAAVEHSSPRTTTAAELRLEESRTSYRVQPDSAGGPSWRLTAITPVATALARHSRMLNRQIEFKLGAALAAIRGEMRFGPDAQLAWHPSKELTLSGSYARTHQFAQSLRNPESVVGNVFPVDVYLGAGASGVPVARCEQDVIAADFRPRRGLRFALQAYERRSDGLVLVAPRDGEPFATGPFAIGSGVSRGVSADAAVNATRYGIVARYGYQRVRLTYGDLSYTPENSAMHLLEGGVTAFPSATTSIRLGATAAMGRRTTAISDGFEWEAFNLLDKGSEFGGSPHYDGEQLGATALPAYLRVDLGLRKQWHVGVGANHATVALFATVTNILGRKNILTYARDPSTGELFGIEMRPRAPLVVGLDWGF